MNQAIAYEGNEPFLFVSYSHKDAAKVSPIVNKLQSEKYRLWYDEGIEAGSEWAANIAEHIKRSSCVIVFMSKNYVESDNCIDELEHAKNLKKATVIIYIEEVNNMPEWISMRHSRTQAVMRYQYEDEDAFYKRLFSAKILHKCNDKNYNKGFLIRDRVLFEYKGDEETIVVPEGVVAITSCAFFENENIRKVVLPEGVAYIGDAAFCNCWNLQAISFPKTLVCIGKDAFFGCENLKNVVFPNNLSAIGEHAFYRCTSLTCIYIPQHAIFIHSSSFCGCESLTEITVDDESEACYLFDGCLYDAGKLLIVPGKKKQIRFPNEINSIGTALSNQKEIVELRIPDGVKRIEDFALTECDSLKKVTIGKGVESIGCRAFANCMDLEEIVICNRKDNLDIHPMAFSDCYANIVFKN